MGRSSKFMASEVRLRSPSWKAWAFVSIALCPAFAGAERATAQATLPPNVVRTPPSIVHPTPIGTLNAAVVPPRFNAAALPIAKLNNNAVPGGVLGPSGSNVLLPSRSPIGGPLAPPGNGNAFVPSGNAGGTVSKTPSNDGGTLGGARAYAPGSYGSNTVCGRYPYPACH
jgi:hypothetical protein